MTIKLKYDILNIYPHNVNHFTQGLTWYNGNLYEGTGLVGMSKVAKIRLNRGNILDKVNSPQDFGEGITILGDKIYQLTWQNHKINIYDLNTLALIQTIDWPNEGWGLTNDGTNLIISNGQNQLYVFNPKTLNVIRIINTSINGLNELEFINGIVYANVYASDNIYLIDYETGNTLAYIDLSQIAKRHKKDGILNGIAYYPPTNSLLITGKHWPLIYNISKKQ